MTMKTKGRHRPSRNELKAEIARLLGEVHALEQPARQLNAAERERRADDENLWRDCSRPQHVHEELRQRIGEILFGKGGC
jgi:hypothetical protein